MPRTRTFKPEFWSDEKLATVSRDARLIFLGLFTCSDDYGVVKGHPGWLRSQIFPYDENVAIGDIVKWLAELEMLKRIILFNHHNERYYFIPKFKDHQKIHNPSQARNPEPPADILEESRETPERLPRESGDNPVETETETETETKEKERAAPPRSSANKTHKKSAEDWPPFKIVKAYLAEKSGEVPGNKTVWALLRGSKQLKTIGFYSRLDPKPAIDYAYSDGITNPEGMLISIARNPDKYVDRFGRWSAFVMRHKLDKKDIQTAGRILAGITERATTEGE